MSEQYFVVYYIGKDEIPGGTSDKLMIKDKNFTLEGARNYRDTIDQSRSPRVVKVID